MKKFSHLCIKSNTEKSGSFDIYYSKFSCEGVIDVLKKFLPNSEIEHYETCCHINKANLLDILDALGDDGWELVEYISEKNPFWMKRKYIFL